MGRPSSEVSAAEVLHARVHALDQYSPDDFRHDEERLLHVISVMQAATSTEMRGLGPVDAAQADAVISKSGLLQYLTKTQRRITAGPLDLKAQQWTGLGPDRTAPRFRPITPVGAPTDSASDAQLAVKPFNSGLYTSTVTDTGPSMWRLYLGLYHGSDLYPLPWSTYQATWPEPIRALEVFSAAGWLNFLKSYSRVTKDGVYPDWKAFGKDYSCLHLCLQAVAAIQGMRFLVDGTLSAPAFYDVETTFWVRPHNVAFQLAEVAT